MEANYDAPVIFRWRNELEDPRIPAMVVQFREAAEKNDIFTAANGYDTFDNVLIALIYPIGMPKSTASAEIERRLPDGTVKTHPTNAKKYAGVVKKYKDAKGGEGNAGTPLKEIGLDPGTCMTLRAKGVHSIEMLAELSDAGGQEIMGFRTFKEKAAKYLEVREKNAPTVRLEMELAKRDEELASLTRQLADLKAAVEAQPEKRGPGRPRKVEQQDEEAA